MKKPKWEDEFRQQFCTVGHDYLLNSDSKAIGKSMVFRLLDFIRKIEQEAFARGWSECKSTYLNMDK
jgi:hypothetical protein